VLVGGALGFLAVGEHARRNVGRCADSTNQLGGVVVCTELGEEVRDGNRLVASEAEGSGHAANWFGVRDLAPLCQSVGPEGGSRGCAEVADGRGEMGIPSLSRWDLITRRCL
jgi:hypothetical protein